MVTAEGGKLQSGIESIELLECVQKWLIVSRLQDCRDIIHKTHIPKVLRYYIGSGKMQILLLESFPVVGASLWRCVGFPSGVGKG